MKRNEDAPSVTLLVEVSSLTTLVPFATSTAAAAAAATATACCRGGRRGSIWRRRGRRRGLDVSWGVMGGSFRRLILRRMTGTRRLWRMAGSRCRIAWHILEALIWERIQGLILEERMAAGWSMRC